MYNLKNVNLYVFYLTYFSKVKMNIQMQKMETIITIEDEEIAGALKENDSFIFCRICFDGMYLDTRLKKINYNNLTV